MRFHPQLFDFFNVLLLGLNHVFSRRHLAHHYFSFNKDVKVSFKAHVSPYLNIRQAVLGVLEFKSKLLDLLVPKVINLSYFLEVRSLGLRSFKDLLFQNFNFSDQIYLRVLLVIKFLFDERILKIQISNVLQKLTLVNLLLFPLFINLLATFELGFNRFDMSIVKLV